uniref:Uncharacterized protein n=1 Tax=Corvus moneduloides TaxID=1196302 RepID=A0A8C3D7U5_CORMO
NDDDSSLDPAAPSSARELTALASGRRNSQCMNMQKRCVNCFISFRKLQYLNNIISLLTSQYCAARTYFALRQLRSNKKNKVYWF